MWSAYIDQVPETKKEQRKRNVIIDSCSLHTGDQRDFLSKIFGQPIRSESTFVVLPTYHMPRFLLTLGCGLKSNNGSLWPNFHPWGFGSPETLHAHKGPRPYNRTFKYEELFAASPTSSREEGKEDCGEIDKILHYQKDGQALSFKDALKYLMGR